MMNQKQWIINNFNNYNNYKELNIAFNIYFNSDLTKDSTRIYSNGLGLYYGKGKRLKQNHVYVKEEIEWLRQNGQTYKSSKELTKSFNNTFCINVSVGALRMKCYELKLNLPNGSVIGQKAIIDFNRNRKRKIGEIFKKQKGQEYIRIKITDDSIKNDYQLLQHYKYEEYHNTKVADNETVIFLNGNRDDYSEDNLLKITKKEYCYLSSKGYMKGNKDIILTMLELHRVEEIVKNI